MLPLLHHGDRLTSEEVNFLPPEVILGLRLATVYLWDHQVTYHDVLSEFLRKAKASENDKDLLFSLFRFYEIVAGTCPEVVNGISRPNKPKIIHIGLGMSSTAFSCCIFFDMKFSLRQILMSHLQPIQRMRSNPYQGHSQE